MSIDASLEALKASKKTNENDAGSSKAIKKKEKKKREAEDGADGERKKKKRKAVEAVDDTAARKEKKHKKKSTPEEVVEESTTPAPQVEVDPSASAALSKKERKEKKRKERKEKEAQIDASAQDESEKGTRLVADSPGSDGEAAEKGEKKKRKKEKKSKASADAPLQTIGLNEASEPSTSSPAIPTPSAAPSHSSLSDSEVSAYLTEHGVTVKADSSLAPESALAPALKPYTTFSALLPRIPPSLHSSVANFKEPSPIQACTWPAALQGRDVIGIAETGSGKTLAFGIPAATKVVNALDPSSSSSDSKEGKKKAKKAKSGSGKKISVLVLAPTRELAIQTHDTLSALGKPLGLTSVALYGGVPKEGQKAALREAGAAFVVGTPGRIQDLVNEGACDLSGVTYLVLDEADRMLDKGFENDIRNIVGHIAPAEQRQTLMFSATWPDLVRKLAASFLKSPVHVTVGSDDLSANRRVEQVVEVFDDTRQKDSRLLSHLRDAGVKPSSAKRPASAEPTRILVFVLYKKEASRVEDTLRQRGFSVAAIHGDLSQGARIAALDDFKTGKVELLVATDVAARGLDIPNVGLVINYSFPLTVEDYIHRIGRTGRGGRSGKSLTFFTGDAHERSLAGEFAKVLREAGFDASALQEKFPMTIKKKTHGVYGAFFRDDIASDVKPTRMVF